MTGRSHLTWDELLTLHESPAADSSERRHVNDCADCAAKLERLSLWLEALPEALEPGAPDLWLRRAEQRSVPRGFFAPLRGVHSAQVVFDNATDRIAGVRGERSDRQWLLASERLEIEVSLSDPREDTPYAVSGQLFAVDGEPPALGGCRVQLEVEAHLIEEVRTEPSGEFLLKARPPGPFRIVLEGAGWRIATPILSP